MDSQSIRTLQWGPLKATQTGNDIVLESNWDDPAKHAEFIAEWIASKSNIRAGIDGKINRAKEIIAAHDPIELLSLVSLECAFTKIHHSGEEEPAEDFVAEYALGLCSAIPFDGTRQSPTHKIATELHELLRAVFSETSMYFGIELAAAAPERKPLVDLRVQTLLKFLFQRGDTHRYYQYDFIRSLYTAHDSFFRAKLGLSVEDAVSELKRICESTPTKCVGQQQAIGKLVQATKLVANALTEGVISDVESIEDFRRKAQALPEVKNLVPNVADLAETLKEIHSRSSSNHRSSKRSRIGYQLALRTMLNSLRLRNRRPGQQIPVCIRRIL